MKLFEKVKNMFTEEVEDEVKVEQVPTKVKKENVPDVIASFEDVKIEKEEVKKPVFFTDHDLDDIKKEQKKSEPVKTDYESRTYRNSYNDYNNDYNRFDDTKKDIYRGNQTNIYNDPYKEKKEERVFKPTPIISPVYGILDKNYHKEDIVTKKEVNNSTNNNENTIDSVRKKAYGTLEDELENTLFGGNSILFNNKEEVNDTDDFFKDLEQEASPDLLNNYNDEEQDKKIRDLEEITMDIGKELNTLLNKKETTKKEEKDEDDLFDLIDTMYEGDE